MQRRWAVTYTKDIKKKFKKSWEDGVLDVDVEGDKVGKLYRSDEGDGVPTGEAVAKGILVGPGTLPDNACHVI
jgi:hypothetical protein